MTSMFSKVMWKTTDKELLRKVDSLSGKWSTKSPVIAQFRARLMTLQKSRCSYCQVPIEVDENGHRELDHVLPKAASKSQDAVKLVSEIFEDRWVTRGYSKFRFDHRNFAIACKQCNTYKGTFDSVLVRAGAKISCYPKQAGLLWVHPQLSKYEDHIDVSDDFIFAGRSAQGVAVIKVCRLDQADVLERKFLYRASARAMHAGSVRASIEALKLGYSSRAFGKIHATSEIERKFRLSKKVAVELFDLAISSDVDAVAMERFVSACAMLALDEGR